MDARRMLEFTEVLGSRCPMDREESLVSALPGISPPRMGAVRQKAVLTFSDYWVMREADWRARMGDTELRALSVAERMAAVLDFVEPTLLPDIAERVRTIIHDGAESDISAQHSPLMLKRAPELHKSLVSYYRLEELRIAREIRFWERDDQEPTTHHIINKTLRGTANANNEMPLYRRFHDTVHDLFDNFPPMMLFVMALGWSRTDNRQFDRDERLVRHLYDLFRELGRMNAEVGAVYRPDVYKHRPHEKLYIMQAMLRIGKNW